MTVLFAANDPTDFPGASHLKRNTSLGFDTAYMASSIEVPPTENVANPFGKTLDAPNTDVWVKFRWTHHTSTFTTGEVDGSMLSFYTADGTKLAMADLVDARIAAVVYNPTATSAAFTAETYFGAGSVHFWDAHIKIDTNILLEIYIGGVLVSSSTTPNTNNYPGVSRVVFDNNDLSYRMNSPSSFISEIIVTGDGESTLGMRLSQVLLSAAGFHSQWQGGVTELGDGIATTAASSGTAGQRVSSTLGTYPGPAAASGVRLVQQAVAGCGSTGPQNLVQFLRIGGVDYDAAAQALSPSMRKDVTLVWETNPATGAAWSTADFAGIEPGLLSQT